VELFSTRLGDARGDKMSKEALNPPAQQEPVTKHYANGGHLVYPTAQRPWVGLTDEEIQECWYKTQGDAELFARAIDAALRSKNEPR